MQYENVLALRVALETGMRIGDVLALRVEDISGRTVRYIAQKTGKADRKVISGRLANELRRNANNGFVFCGRSGDKPRTRQTVYRDLKGAVEQSRIKAHVTPHSARKTMAVDYYHEHGLSATQNALQHDRADTTMIYAFADILNDSGSAPAKGSNRAEVAEAAAIIAAAVCDELERRGYIKKEQD